MVLVSIILLFHALHITHISSFYCIKTYYDSLNVNEIKHHFENITSLPPPIIIAEVSIEIRLSIILYIERSIKG